MHLLAGLWRYLRCGFATHRMGRVLHGGNVRRPNRPETLEPRHMLSGVGYEPGLWIDDWFLDEAEGQAEFGVWLDFASEETITVDYATADGTAVAGLDYIQTNGVLTFLPGEVYQSIPVAVIDDALEEFEEQFLLELSNPAGAVLYHGQGIATIYENDQPPMLDPIGDQYIDEEMELWLQATAYDPDSPETTLTYSLDAGAPESMTIDSISGEIFWIPTEADGPGTFEITVRVTNSETPAQSASETISIEVAEVNMAPTTTGVADVTVNEDADNTVIDLFSAFDDQEDADSELTYNINYNGAPELFSSVTIDQATGELTLAYAPNAWGMADFSIEAMDSGGLTVEVYFMVDIVPVNDAPVITSFVGVELSNNRWTFSGTVSDVDDDPTGWLITLGGVLASYGYSPDVQSDGSFTLTEFFHGLPDANATAETSDSFGLTSNLAFYYVET